jgi:uncharacterized SAM-binding protein YcdF (DUF218 family)
MIKLLITVEAWLLLLTVIVFILSRKWNKRRRNVGFALVGLCWLVCLTGYLPQYLLKTLESKYPPVSNKALQALPQGAYILVLGSGHTYDTSLTPVEQLSGMALSRLVQGVRIYKLLPGSKMIGSGYSSDPNSPAQALVLRGAGISLGVPDSNFLVQSSPSNTREEAMSYRKLFGTQHPLVLVTSAIHMPRAVYYFQSQGLHPLPAPANYMVKPNPVKPSKKWIPSINNLNFLNAALREWAGILEFKWRYS